MSRPLHLAAPALLTLYALLRGERLPGKALLGVAVALLGAYVLVVGSKGFTASPLGVAYGLLSALSLRRRRSLTAGASRRIGGHDLRISKI